MVLVLMLSPKHLEIYIPVSYSIQCRVSLPHEGFYTSGLSNITGDLRRKLTTLFNSSHCLRNESILFFSDINYSDKVFVSIFSVHLKVKRLDFYEECKPGVISTLPIH